jgi:N4-gp56 family major capsid protein
MGMAFGGSNVIVSDLSTSGFIPTQWMDEIMAAYKKHVVMAGLVRKINVKGKKGDTVKLPKPTRGAAAAKSTNTVVTTLVASGGASVTVSLTAHYEYSRLIEDIAEVQALASMRKFYTDDAGYALSLKKDSVIFDAARTLNGGDGASTWTGAVIAGDGTTAFVDASGNANATAITDAGIRRVIQVLDDNDIPMSDRALVIPPVGRRIMMGLARFTEQAFVGDGKTIRNGKLGDVYGVGVYVTSNCPTPTSATIARVGVLLHKDALILADVLGPRVQTQYKQEYLATLLTADTIFGVAEAYDKGGVAMAMPG